MEIEPESPFNRMLPRLIYIESLQPCQPTTILIYSTILGVKTSRQRREPSGGPRKYDVKYTKVSTYFATTPNYPRLIVRASPEAKDMAYGCDMWKIPRIDGCTLSCNGGLWGSASWILPSSG